MAAAPVGIVSNPAAGRDIRRVVAHASVFNNEEKRSIVKRAVVGAVAGGARSFLYLPIPFHIDEDLFTDAGVEAAFLPLETPGTNSAIDTARAAQQLQQAGCGAVIILGGDGTNRAFVKGWLDAPLAPISSGTNNVFPRLMEGTVAGAAAGLVASGRIALEDVAVQAKRILVEVEGNADDVALIDAAVLAERFVGSRAIWDVATLRMVVVTRADPSVVGLAGLAGLLNPISSADDLGVLIEPGDGCRTVNAPIAPGLYKPVPVRAVRELALGEPVEACGPGVISLDGEREIVLQEGQRARLTVLRDGPRVIDVARALRRAARDSLFEVPARGGTDGD